MSHTPGPWAWSLAGDKDNGYIVGVAWVGGEQRAGFLDVEDYIDDPTLELTMLGELQQATVNYDDAALIAAAPDLLDALELLVDRCSDDDVLASFESDGHKADAIERALAVCGRARNREGL